MLAQIDEVQLLVDRQIVDEGYHQLAVDYSLEKGFVITADELTFRHRKIVTRRPALPTMQETSCQKAQ
jgi:hypothetical protein